MTRHSTAQCSNRPTIGGRSGSRVALTTKMRTRATSTEFTRPGADMAFSHTLYSGSHYAYTAPATGIATCAQNRAWNRAQKLFRRARNYRNRFRVLNDDRFVRRPHSPVGVATRKKNLLSPPLRRLSVVASHHCHVGKQSLSNPLLVAKLQPILEHSPSDT